MNYLVATKKLTFYVKYGIIILGIYCCLAKKANSLSIIGG